MVIFLTDNDDHGRLLSLALTV